MKKKNIILIIVILVLIFISIFSILISKDKSVDAKSNTTTNTLIVEERECFGIVYDRDGRVIYVFNDANI